MAKMAKMAINKRGPYFEYEAFPFLFFLVGGLSGFSVIISFSFLKEKKKKNYIPASVSLNFIEEK